MALWGVNVSKLPIELEEWMKVKEKDYSQRWANKFPSDLEHDLWLMRACYREMAEHLIPVVEACKDIGAPRACGCKPVCQCLSQQSLEIEVDAIKDVAREALAEVGLGGGDE